jgi:hypothetical protein
MKNKKSFFFPQMDYCKSENLWICIINFAIFLDQSTATTKKMSTKIFNSTSLEEKNIYG